MTVFFEKISLQYHYFVPFYEFFEAQYLSGQRVVLPHYMSMLRFRIIGLGKVNTTTFPPFVIDKMGIKFVWKLNI